MEGIARHLPGDIVGRMLDETRAGRLAWVVDPYTFNLCSRGAGGRSAVLEGVMFPTRLVLREGGAVLAVLRDGRLPLLAEAAEASLNRRREQDCIATRRAED